MAGKATTRIWKIEQGAGEPLSDQLAVEEPLEIRLAWQGESRVVAVTMRTPGEVGEDGELAAGFLFAEGVVDRPERIVALRTVAPNIVQVELGDGPEPQLAPLDRHFFATSACGVCGKAGIETLRLRAVADLPSGPVISPDVLRSLPGALRERQGLFAATGGLHAAALFDASGALLDAREDVGRHNALDKLLGRAFLDSRLPLHDHLVMVSGRSSYEILQKCLAAGVPVVCAVSAPSSLAVELAGRFGITLVGFLRGDRFNVYSGIERIAVDLPEPPDCSQRRRERLLPITL